MNLTYDLFDGGDDDYVVLTVVQDYLCLEKSKLK